MKSAELNKGIPEELITTDTVLFEKVTKELLELYAKKNHDYGNSFDKGMKELGSVYGISRLFDKMNRLIALHGREDTIEVLDEKYEDTLMDLAAYAIMTITYRRKSKYNNDISVPFAS